MFIFSIRTKTKSLRSFWDRGPQFFLDCFAFRFSALTTCHSLFMVISNHSTSTVQFSVNSNISLPFHYQANFTLKSKEIWMALFARSGRFVVRGSSCGFPGFPLHRSFDQASSLTAKFEFCYSTKSGEAKSRRKSKAKKLDSKPAMDEEKNAFFVVRKGDLVGVYKNFSDCQAQVGSSIFDPPVSIFKGYTMSKETEDYMRSCGLRNALYLVRAADLKEELFGTLVPCPLQEPPAFNGETAGRSCSLEFDGSSKGNPGKAGAGAVLRTDDGSLICKLREGLGIATCNVAEYRALILGLRYALNKGFTTIRVQGDSKLVCMQVQGLWRVRNENISRWCEEAIKLKDGFLSFQINHVLREYNSEADAEANFAAELSDGQVNEVL